MHSKFKKNFGWAAKITVEIKKKNNSEMREKVKDTVCDLAEKHSPAVNEAKRQAMESIDLLKYKLEKQYKKFGNMLKSKKMRKAKELEEVSDYDF